MMQASEHCALGAYLMSTYFARMRAGGFGGQQIPNGIAKQVWNEAHYCLDAPEIIFAGSMTSFDVDEEMTSVPIESHILREQNL